MKPYINNGRGEYQVQCSLQCALAFYEPPVDITNMKWTNNIMDRPITFQMCTNSFVYFRLFYFLISCSLKYLQSRHEEDNQHLAWAVMSAETIDIYLSLRKYLNVTAS